MRVAESILATAGDVRDSDKDYIFDDFLETRMTTDLELATYVAVVIATSAPGTEIVSGGARTVSTNRNQFRPGNCGSWNGNAVKSMLKMAWMCSAPVGSATVIARTLELGSLKPG